MIRFNLLKDGKHHAVTFSYDDGQPFDDRLIEIFNAHGLKGTFHLNSGREFGEGCSRIENIKELYEGHEISCHGVLHEYLNNIPTPAIHHEIFEDRIALEKRAGSIVRGMSYAFGQYSDSVIEALKNCGIVYSRTTKSTNGFGIPEDFMKWHPTCHHLGAMDCLEPFKKRCEQKGWINPGIFYIWGHSYEFDRMNNWDLIEDFADKIAGWDNVWYATNIELYEYITAQRSLIVSADCSIVHNPTATTVWFSNDAEPVKIEGGQTLYLK